MNLLTILTEKGADRIQEEMEVVLKSFYKEGVNITEILYIKDSIYYLDYSIPKEDITNCPINNFINIFKFCSANAICGYIKNFEEPNLIEDMINKDYGYFDSIEKRYIYRNAIDILKDENEKRFFYKNDAVSSKTKMVGSLKDYLDEDVEVNLKGFLKFRLKDYCIELNMIIDKAVEDFLLDREYNEFIKLLRYFVDIQEPTSKSIHIIFDQERRFKLYDEYNTLLNNDYLTNVADDIYKSNMNEDDILISTLITMAPKQIFIHGLSFSNNPEIVKTLEKIFVGRINCCDNCKLCNTQEHISKEEKPAP